MFRWEGEGLNEVGRDRATNVIRVKVNPKYFRPAEVVSIHRVLRLSLISRLLKRISGVVS